MTDDTGRIDDRALGALKDVRFREHFKSAKGRALAEGKRGTLKAWMKRNTGKQVDTFQAGRSLWATTGRTIDADARSTGVLLSGSLRDYSGMSVLGVCDDAILCWEKGFEREVLYVLTK